MVYDFFGMVHMPIQVWLFFFYISQMDLSFFLFRWIVNCLFRLKTDRKQSFIIQPYCQFSNLQINSSLSTQNQYFSNEICSVLFRFVDP